MPQTTPQSQSGSGGNGYVLLDPWSWSQTTFNDINSLPEDPKDLGPMTKVTLWSNGDLSTFMLQSYSFEFSEQHLTLANPVSPHFQAQKCEHVLKKGEYVTAVDVTGTTHTTMDAGGTCSQSKYCSLSSMTITTANPARKMILSPTQSAWKVNNQVTFTAPSGMRIVGFRGYSGAYSDYRVPGNSRWPFLGLGAIIAPLAI